ncbi:MAG TPA: aminoglycoside phosphotransferase family protein, partial [Rhodothermales bacterium]|nr:aminoglycoside phosphotransferase family protein [Rhodothermales bacterium]
MLGRLQQFYWTSRPEWLAALSVLKTRAVQRWGLTLGAPFPQSHYGYVAPCLRRDGSPAVLKLVPPGSEEANGTEALRWLDPRGAARVLDAVPEDGAYLIERLLPGTVLTDLCAKDDDCATTLAAEVMLRLWRPVSTGTPFMSLDRWTQALERVSYAELGPLAERLGEEARTARQYLLATAGPPVLLHGDLHHDNVLAASRYSWLAIDPKGIVGERAFEVTTLLRNPAAFLNTVADLRGLMVRRIARLATDL